MRLLHLASALSSVSLAVAWTTYIVPYSGGGDDTPTLAAAFTADPKLATNATILFEHGVTYNILTPIRFPRLENVIISVQGNLTYAADIKATQGENLPPEYEFLALISGVRLYQRLLRLRWVVLLLSEIFAFSEHSTFSRHILGIG